MARRPTAATFNEQMRRICRHYIAQGGASPIRMDDLCDFARKNGLWEPRSSDVRKQFRTQMSRALREEHFTDARGRSVRRYHAAMAPGFDADGNRVKQALWDDIDTAPLKHMAEAFQLRRGQVVGDCRQLRNDVDYYNGRHEDQPPIPMLFDFTDDVEEAGLPTEYYPGEVD